MSRLLLTGMMSLLSLTFSANAQTKSKKREVKVTKKKELNDKGDSVVVYYGVASYYADKFTGRQTANGASYSHTKMTAACNVLPLGTWIRITNLKNNKSIVVQVNDRLHSKNNRLVDISKSGAEKLNYIKNGLARVKVEVLGKKKPKL